MLLPHQHTNTPILCIAFPPYFLYLRNAAGNRLLRQFFVENFRDALGLQVIHALLALHGIAHGLNEFCRLDVSGTALDAGKAAQTGVDALRGISSSSIRPFSTMETN